MSRFLLVEMEEDLAAQRTTRTSVFRGIKLVPGVKCVTDMAIVSPQAYEERMLPRGLSLIPDQKRRRP